MMLCPVVPLRFALAVFLAAARATATPSWQGVAASVSITYFPMSVAATAAAIIVGRMLTIAIVFRDAMLHQPGC